MSAGALCLERVTRRYDTGRAAVGGLTLEIGRGELVPFASYYRTGFLNEKPLAKLRGDMARLGIARAESVKEPEDHIAALCEMMAGLITGAFGAPQGLAAQQQGLGLVILVVGQQKAFIGLQSNLEGLVACLPGALLQAFTRITADVYTKCGEGNVQQFTIAPALGFPVARQRAETVVDMHGAQPEAQGEAEGHPGKDQCLEDEAGHHRLRVARHAPEVVDGEPHAEPQHDHAQRQRQQQVGQQRCLHPYPLPSVSSRRASPAAAVSCTPRQGTPRGISARANSTLPTTRTKRHAPPPHPSHGAAAPHRSSSSRASRSGSTKTISFCCATIPRSIAIAIQRAKPPRSWSAAGRQNPA